MANKNIINEFEKLIKQIKYDFDNSTDKKEQIQHSFRLKQTKAVLKIIKEYPKKITSGEQLADIKGVGKRSVDRINEILKTGSLSEIKIPKKYKKYIKYIEELEQVFGIGRVKAHELVTKYNIKSVEDLKKAYKNNKIELSEQIAVGLKYHGVYKENIPREEIDRVDVLVQKVADKVGVDAKICGSYRRGKPTSNDIDILIYNPKIKTKKDILSQGDNNYLHRFIYQLKKSKFILDDLTFEDYNTKYMGFCRLGKSPVRRLDIYYTPAESYYTSLLHLTGSGGFNRKMRGLAIELGYRLNEYGLFKIKDDVKKRIIVKSEKDIFEKLGMEYLEPSKR